MADTAPQNEERTPERKKFRLRWDGENAWCEHVEGNIFRALNHCIGDAELKLPADVQGLPEGHPGPDKNGTCIRIHWGHLLECEETSSWSVRPLFIVGWDGRPTHDAGVRS